jgi:hypothetical protein
MIGSEPVKAIDDCDGCQTRFSWPILMKTPLIINTLNLKSGKSERSGGQIFQGLPVRPGRIAPG